MKKGKNKAMDGVKITPEIIAEMRDVIFSLNTAMDAASTIPASAFVGRDVSRLFNLAATQARAVISKLATTQSRQERETATLHAQIARLKTREGEALTGEEYFADRDLFMRYVANHVQPARLKAGLAVLSERSCEVSYEIITSKRYRAALQSVAKEGETKSL